MNGNSQERLLKMKKAGKKLSLISVIAGILVVVVLILFCIMPATNLTASGGKYTDGYNYYGWQMIFFGCGYVPLTILHLFEDAATIAGDYVPTSWDFDFNIYTFLGWLIPIVAVIVCSIVGSRMKNRGKAACEFIMAAAILFGGIMLLNVASLSTLVATDMGSGLGFKEQYLLPAIEAGTYKTLFYPIFTFVVCLIVALFKIFRGVFLLYQRSFARKNRPAKNQQA